MIQIYQYCLSFLKKQKKKRKRIKKRNTINTNITEIEEYAIIAQGIEKKCEE